MQDECRVELYIVERFRRGKQTDVLSSCRLTAKPIEQAFGATLLWERLEGRRACRISYTRQGGGYRSPEEQWPQIQDKTIHDMDRLMKALQPYLKQLNVSSYARRALAISAGGRQLDFLRRTVWNVERHNALSLTTQEQVMVRTLWT
jgi:hypothetical protein